MLTTQKIKGSQVQSSHNLSFSNPDKVWAVKALGNLTEEWQQWYAYVQNLEDHADYDPNTCTEAVKDGWENIRKHEILREKTLVFLRNNFSGYEFLFENWAGHPHEDVTSRLRPKVPTWLHRLEILRASLDYHVSGERTMKERPLLKTPSVSPQQWIQLLQRQIEKAKNLFKDRALIQENDYDAWVNTTSAVVEKAFDKASSKHVLFRNTNHNHQSERENLDAALALLGSFIEQLELDMELGSQSETNSESSDALSAIHDMYGIHPVIKEKCYELYNNTTYAEAVEKSFKVVKDKLRSLTGYESGSDAFGKGKLYIKGAAAPNVEEDFNQAVKFLTMAIDQFRNEKSHTSDAKIEDPIRAYQYLVLSSLAMSLLENSQIRP